MGTPPPPDPDRLAVIAACMEAYGIGEADAEWPNNLVSRRAIAYRDGTIARTDAVVSHVVDEAELSLCERLSSEAAALMAGVGVGMGSEADDPFRAFFVAAPAGSSSPERIDEALVRARFGGTLFPPATITVEPFAEDTVWWGEVAEDGAESEPDYFDPWRALSAWFRGQPAFEATAFVRVGDADALSRLPRTSWPPGTAMPGCVLPRLAVGLTHRGSLAGLFGHVVQS